MKWYYLKIWKNGRVKRCRMRKKLDMATSSSDESLTAPKDFHLSSSLDSGSRNSPIPQKCPLCWNFRKKFYCRECIYNGEICHTNSTERYIDKKLRLREIIGAKKSYENTCLPLLEKRLELDKLCSSIRQKQEWISILRLGIKEKKEKRTLLQNELKDKSHKNEKLSKSLPKYEEKVEELGCYVEGKEEKIKRAKMELEKKRHDLQQLTRVRIKQLMEYIFPITLVQPKLEVESSSSDMVSALAEATHTTYITDRWVYTDNSGELQHCIVAPTLPGSGNYSAYNVWVVQNKDSVPSSHSTTAVEHNSAYNISAALTYTAQLVNVFAFYLDIRLLHKMSYSDLSGSDMKEQTFARRVARLNANILQLCFSQSTNLEFLHPARTLHNIMQLLDPNVSNLGRKGPLEVDAQMANNLEEQLSYDLYTSETSDSEECDALPNEWEAVPHVQCPEVPAGAVIVPTPQMTTTQQASSMAGGLVVSAAASIASIWRGWTGR